MDRQCGDRVDLLVCLHQLAPGGAVVECERMREVPRELGFFERVECEEDRVARARGERGDNLVTVARPSLARGLVQPSRGRGRGPLAEHRQPRIERLGRWAMSFQESAPVVGCLE